MYYPGQSYNKIIMIRIQPMAFVYKNTDGKSLSRLHLFKFIWAPQTSLIIVFFNKFLVNIRSALLKILALLVSAQLKYLKQWSFSFLFHG